MRRACVLIPGYNAAQTIGPLIRQIKTMGLDVVMLDDGSTDHTAKTATDAGARVISHVRNQGKGSALRDGFAYAVQAGYDMVITLDSDGQHDPRDIPRLLEAAQQPHANILLRINISNLARNSRHAPELKALRLCRLFWKYHATKEAGKLFKTTLIWIQICCQWKL